MIHKIINSQRLKQIQVLLSINKLMYKLTTITNKKFKTSQLLPLINNMIHKIIKFPPLSKNKSKFKDQTMNIKFLMKFKKS